MSFSQIPDRDEALSLIAADQFGAVHRDQLYALGLDRSAIARRVKKFQLHQLSSDVFAVGHARIERRGKTIAAFLQLGGQAAVSHESAARSWGMVDQATDGDIHITALRRSGRVVMPEGTKLHRPRREVLREQVVHHRGFATTTPERTLRDLLAESDVAQITRMLERMVTQLGRSPDMLHAWGESSEVSHARGRPDLLRALDNVVGPVVLRSKLETEFRTICQRAGLPIAETNVRLGRWEVDVLWRHLRLIVELDSWQFHGGKWAFHRDRRKALDLAADGYEVIRLTWAQLKYDSDEVVAALRRVIARREIAAGA